MAYAYGTASWLVSTFQLSGTPDMYFYNCIAEIYYNYFNIAKARRERRERSRGEREGGEWSVSEGGRKREKRSCEDTHRRAQARESTRWMPRR